MTVTASPQNSTPPILVNAPVVPEAPITELDHMVNHLKQAAYLEMSTIPMYLYSAFSISSRGYSQWNPGIGPFRLIRSIVVEEMLHLCLVRNLIVALGRGDQVRFYDPEFIPRYPSDMLHRHPRLMLHLSPCHRDMVKHVFMELERPKADPGEGRCPPGQYATIGRFYRAIDKGLTHLAATMGASLWSGNEPSFQYVAAYWNNDGGGEPVLIRDLESARGALTTIVEQGEGIDPSKPSVPIDPLKPVPGLDEMPHYTKFKRIADGVEPITGTWPLPTDPRSEHYTPDEAVSCINTLFNAAYCYVLHMLDVIYKTSWQDVSAGQRSPRYHYERTFISAMQGILVSVAEIMVATPVTAGPHGGTCHAGPTFEYYELPERGKTDHLLKLCHEAMAYFPSLGGDNGVQWLIGKLPEDL